MIANTIGGIPLTNFKALDSRRPQLANAAVQHDDNDGSATALADKRVSEAMRNPFRGAGLAVLLTAAAAVAPAMADTAGVTTAGTQVGKVMSHEQLMLRSASGARIAELTDIVRPKAREGEAIELAATSGPLDLATLDAMPAAKGDAQWACLAQAIYFESRGEPLAGQIAVAEVVLNRVDDRNFPSTVCGVTNQGCQFSYTCDGNSDVMKSPVARDRSEKLASLMLAGRARTVSDGATYFHARSVRPDWSRRFTRTTTIGHHMFYRPATQVAGG